VPTQKQEEEHQQPRPVQLEHDYDEIFDELNMHYEGFHQQIIEQRCIAAAEAEITLYKMEPSVRLKDDNNNFDCTLSWWKKNESKYKLLAGMAARFLCIPATSAPSEHVFLVAGLMIAKDRARLSPENANELVFLHDAEPAIKCYEKLQW
jgi:hypothetical protein